MSESPSRPLGDDPWRLVEHAPDPARAALHETLFALGNGRIGVRGAHEEGRCWPGTEQDAIYVNGFHDTEDIHYAENAFGLARHNQFIVNLPNGKSIEWAIDGEPFDPTRGRIEGYERSLDLRSGLITRSFVWTSPAGRRVAVHSTRLVSMVREQLYALSLQLRPLDAAAQLAITSSLDARGQQIAASDDPRVGSAHAAQALVQTGLQRSGERAVLSHRTRRSGLQVVSAIDHHLHVGATVGVDAEPCGDDDCPGTVFRIDTPAGEAVQLVKFCAIVTSLDQPADAEIDALRAHADAQLALAREAGFDALCAEQHDTWSRHWRDADVEIDGDDALQQGLRFNLFHLRQSAGRDGRTNIAAKGVTGSGYDGHYFWDTEVYVLPALLHSQPATARALLEFRFNTLDAARARAREMNHARGALFPWRTISGPECSSYFPAGTAQFHLNADIAHAVRRYWHATGDDVFMLQDGAELVFETARIWLDLGHFAPGHSERGGRFCIHTVTGPDEYTALVDNNFYTNAMARVHLRFAVEVAVWLAAEHPHSWQRLASAIALAPGEPDAWRRAADAMHLPYDATLGIHPQDDSFLAKPRWEAASIPPDKRPLLLHYHPLVIYRHQVCKQADVLLALLLLSDEFTLADKRRDFDYYEPLTTHDSSLSRCIFGIVASEIGQHDKAYRYFVDGARADLDDHHGNTRHGVHTAAMAGAWLGVVAGFAGMRMQRGEPSFAPRLPQGWSRCAFKLRFGDAQLRVVLDAQGSHYELLQGDALALRHRGTPLRLSAAAPRASMALQVDEAEQPA